MYQIHTPEEIMHPFIKRAPLPLYMRDKLSLAAWDVSPVLDMMQCLLGMHMSEEVVFSGDTGDGLYLEHEKAEQMVEIAVNGQGDSWLMELSEDTICFFDHNDGSITRMGIDFRQFLQLADLIEQYEQSYEPGVYDAMRMIDAGLPEKYPFQLQEDADGL